MRLDKFLSNNGFGSRKDVKSIIKKKQVSVHDSFDIKPETDINPSSDTIKVNNKIVEYKEFYYFLLNKPKGYISATEDYKQSTVLDLLPEYSHLDLFPVGRLDKDTTGVLLLTTDGPLAHYLLSPKRHVDKVYIATLDKEIPLSIKEQFEKGILLDGELTLPAKLNIISSNKAEVTIHQGKYHQVKRMFAYFGLEVVELHREKFAFLTVEGLEEGKYRELTPQETIKLKEMTPTK